MSTIFPGNYVAHLNAYREQGVEALPGVEFYQARAALVLNPDNDSVTTAGTLSAVSERPGSRGRAWRSGGSCIPATDRRRSPARAARRARRGRPRSRRAC